MGEHGVYKTITCSQFETDGWYNNKLEPTISFNGSSTPVKSHDYHSTIQMQGTVTPQAPSQGRETSEPDFNITGTHIETGTVEGVDDPSTPGPRAPTGTDVTTTNIDETVSADSKKNGSAQVAAKYGQPTAQARYDLIEVGAACRKLLNTFPSPAG